MRRQQKNIQVYLQKTLELEDKKAVDTNRKGGRGKNAADVAKETKLKPVGGDKYMREKRAVQQAKAARDIFRDYQAVKAVEIAAKVKRGEIPPPGEEFEETTLARRGGAKLDAGHLAALLSEELEAGGNGDEDGEEDGEEDAED